MQEFRRLDRTEIEAAVKRQLAQASGPEASEILKTRQDLMRRYFGEPYGDETEGYSQVVSRDVMDTIEWLKPELLSIFLAGDEVVRFEPVGPEDEEAAKQETEVVNHVLLNDPNSFATFYTWFTNALLLNTSVVKRYVDFTEREQPGTGFGLTEMQMAMLAADEAVTIEQVEQQQDPATGEMLYSVKYRHRKVEPKFCVEPVEPSEFIITPRWNKLTLDGCPFCAHVRDDLVVGDLVEMGFDAEQVLRVSERVRWSGWNYGNESSAIDTRTGWSEREDVDPPDAASRPVRLAECYVRLDVEGVGRTRLYKVYMGGSHWELLRYAAPEGGEAYDAIEEVDEAPFHALTPIIVGHRFYGMSVAECLVDLARIKTVLLRQGLDSLYGNIVGERYVNEDALTETTLDDMTAPAARKIVVVRGQPAAAVMDLRTPSAIGEVLPMIEHIDQVREQRSGFLRSAQGLSPDTLNKSGTLGEAQLLANQGQQRKALIARVFAETGVKSLAIGLHKDLRKYGLRSKALRLRNQWVEVDPRGWAERTDMTVAVGLGTGDKQQQIANMMAVLMQQKEALAAGGLGMVTPKHIHNTLTKLVNLVGEKSVEPFFADPESGTVPPPEPQSDPMLQIEQLKAQVKQFELQTNAQLEMARLQLEREKMLRQDDRERDKVEADIVIRAAELAGEVEARAMERVDRQRDAETAEAA